jgi:hypothetical protein
LDVIGEGGHGAVHNVDISDDVKKKYLNSSCRDFVMKKVSIELDTLLLVFIMVEGGVSCLGMIYIYF